MLSHNRRGLALYKKMGSAIEGVKQHSLCADGAWVDEVLMTKILK
jgi:hypothetical protein